MIDFMIYEIAIGDNEYKIKWNTNKEVSFLKREDIVIRYDFKVRRNYFLPLNIALSAFLPILVKKFKNVKVISPYSFDELTKDYWKNYIREILQGDEFNLSFEGGDIDLRHDELFSSNSSDIGLFFGGGIESMFALSTMYHKRPILLSVVGKDWMNNDNVLGGLKFSLENELCEKYSLQIQRVEINLRPLMLFGDKEMNQFITGGLFYFLVLPIADRFGIGTIYHSIEYECASTFCDYDLSLNPRFTKNLYIKDAKFPLVFSIYNAYPKIKLFEGLSKTEFVKYIYSCFRNADKRWCGKCPKCFRISEFCERIGLDRSIIGMQEGIVGLKEKSPIAKRYWQMMDILYGRKLKREINIAIKYYKAKAIKVVRKILGYKRID